MDPLGWDSEIYVRECLLRSDAPIKPQFLRDGLTYEPLIRARGGATVNRNFDDNVASETERGLPSNKLNGEFIPYDCQTVNENAETNEKNKKPRGQNKKRKLNADAAKLSKTFQICTEMASIGVCTRPNCPRSHDLIAAVAKLSVATTDASSDQVTGICVWKSRFCVCPQGVNCVGGLSHVDAEGYNIHPETKLRVTPFDVNELHSTEETNHTKVVINKTKEMGLHKRSSEGRTFGMERKPDVEAKRESMKSLLKGKTVLAPLTTVGNLPFRRLCLKQGVDATMSEMVLASSLCGLQTSDLALLRRHKDEKLFGLQLAGGYADQLNRAAEIIEAAGISCDWVDINMGCPLEGLHKRGAGAALLHREIHIESIIRGMNARLHCPLTVKSRTGFTHKSDHVVHNLIPKLINWGVGGITLHGRTAKQRYLRDADWGYIETCTEVVDSSCLFVGNGDLFSPQGIVSLWEQSKVDAIMIGAQRYTLV